LLLRAGGLGLRPANEFRAKCRPGAFLPVGSKQLSVTFTRNDTANYTSTTKVVPLTVSPETLTIFANSYTRLYGLANPAFQGSITGAQNGDIFSEAFSTAASTSSAPGQYPIIPAASGTNLSDYVLVVQNGTLTVTQAPVVIQPPSARLR
jgi:hypothetical protein